MPAPVNQILLVEDEILVGMAMRDLLTDLGYNVLGPYGDVGFFEEYSLRFRGAPDGSVVHQQRRRPDPAPSRLGIGGAGEPSHPAGGHGQQVALVGLGHRRQRGAHALAANVCGHRLQQRRELGGRIAGEQPGRRGVELAGRRGDLPPVELDPGAHLLLGQRTLPTGVGVYEDQRHHEVGMVAVELEHDGAAPGQARDNRRPQLERVDQRRETARVVRQAETRRHVRRATGPRLVPGHDSELIG